MKLPKILEDQWLPHKMVACLVIAVLAIVFVPQVLA